MCPPRVDDARLVLHSVQSWLPLSEQFIHALVSRSRHRSTVVARLPLEHTDVFPYRPVHSLGAIPRHLPAPVERRLVTAGLFLVTARRRPALVHHHHGYRCQDPIGYVRRRQIPLVLSLHGEDVTAYVRRWPEALQEALDLASAVLVPSQYLAERAASIGARPETLRVIPSGVDTTSFTPSPLPDGPPEALFVGRFVEKKGIDTLLAAWTSVRRAVPHATLRLVGFGPLEAQARAGGEGVIVELTNPKCRLAQVIEAMRRARVVVSPSRTAADGDVESLLLVNLEAQASGRPVVTTRHGGIPEFVEEGRTALLVPEGDAAALARAMICVLKDQTLAVSLSRAGPQWVARFDVEKCTAAVDDLYEELMGS